MEAKMLKQFKEGKENPESDSFQILNLSNRSRKMKDYTDEYTERIQLYEAAIEANKEEARAVKKRRRAEASLPKQECIGNFKHKRTNTKLTDLEIKTAYDKLQGDFSLTIREYGYFYTRNYKKAEAKKLSFEEFSNLKNKRTKNANKE